MVPNDNVRNVLPSRSSAGLTPMLFYLLQPLCISNYHHQVKLRPERLECFKWLTAHNSFYTNWHPLLSIKQWTPGEPKCIFVPISSADHTIYHCSIPAHNKLWFHCPVQACLSIGWDDVTVWLLQKDHRVWRCVL